MAEVSPRLRALLVGEDPMIRYLVRESLASQGVQAAAEAASPREITPQARHENSSGVVVLCLSGPPEIWRNTIAETRRTLPGGRVVAVTFGNDVQAQGKNAVDPVLGADTQVSAPADPSKLREAVLRAKFDRAPATVPEEAP